MLAAVAPAGVFASASMLGVGGLSVGIIGRYAE